MKFKTAAIMSFICTTICLACKDIYESKKNSGMVGKPCMCAEEKPDVSSVHMEFSKFYTNEDIPEVETDEDENLKAT